MQPNVCSCKLLSKIVLSALYVCNVFVTGERCFIGSQSNIQTDQEGEREALEREGLDKGGIGERGLF